MGVFNKNYSNKPSNDRGFLTLEEKVLTFFNKDV